MNLFQRKGQRKILYACRREGGRKEGFIMNKFCTRCGRKFESVGREVICPACKAQAAEETKRAAVLKAKRASWTGESVPVRISGRASTVIRAYSAANGMPFASALDELLKASAFFKSTGKAWQDVEPYKSRRRSKSTTENTTETAEKQDTASKPQEVKPQDVKQAAKTSKKTSSKSSSKSSSPKKG